MDAHTHAHTHQEAIAGCGVTRSVARARWANHGASATHTYAHSTAGRAVIGALVTACGAWGLQAGTQVHDWGLGFILRVDRCVASQG